MRGLSTIFLMFLWLLGAGIIIGKGFFSPCYACDEDKRKCPKCIYSRVRRKHSKFVAREEKDNDNNKGSV